MAKNACHAFNAALASRIHLHQFLQSERGRLSEKKLLIYRSVFSPAGHRQTTEKIIGTVLTSVLNQAVLSGNSGGFTYEKRRGRESNPRIAVLQTATLPLGYPARVESGQYRYSGACMN